MILANFKSGFGQLLCTKVSVVRFGGSLFSANVVKIAFLMTVKKWFFQTDHFVFFENNKTL